MNETKIITAYLIDVNHKIDTPISIPATLATYYELLDCRLIDMVERRIGPRRRSRTYTIICDDEGLLRSQPKISAIDDLGQPMLVGNLLIVKTGPEGETIGLDDDDITFLQQHIHLQATRRFPDPYPMLHQVDY